jgi:hypothetical protein
MNNKEYKAIVKKAVKRFERLQELELKDSNGIKNRVNWFIAEYISKNQLKEFFREELLNNSETQIYLLRDHKKIPIMRVGNKVVKTNLIKRLDNLMNFLNESEKMKHAFIKKFSTLNWKYSFDFDEEDRVYTLTFKNRFGDSLTIQGFYFDNNKIRFGCYKTTKVHGEQRLPENQRKGRIKETTSQTIFFDKTEYFTFDELKELLNQVRKVEDEIYLIVAYT